MITPTLTREARGHSWVTGDKAPIIPGWTCFFVSHYGMERTVWTYKPERKS